MMFNVKEILRVRIRALKNKQALQSDSSVGSDSSNKRSYSGDPCRAVKEFVGCRLMPRPLLLQSAKPQPKPKNISVLVNTQLQFSLMIMMMIHPWSLNFTFNLTLI